MTKTINDSINHPLRVIVGAKTFGQFYNSWDKKYHLAEYAPYETPPSVYVCGGRGNFSPSRAEFARNTCGDCWSLVDD